jgi:arginase family enzyme
VGARNLDPPEEEYIAAHGVHLGEEGISRALDGSGCAYVAIDLDVLEPSEASVFSPEPGGFSVDEAERLLRAVEARTKVLGAGITGATFEPANVGPISRLTAALEL